MTKVDWALVIVILLLMIWVFAVLVTTFISAGATQEYQKSSIDIIKSKAANQCSCLDKWVASDNTTHIGMTVDGKQYELVIK